MFISEPVRDRGNVEILLEVHNKSKEKQDQYRVWTWVAAKHSSDSFIPSVFVCGSIITGEHLQYVYKPCAKFE